MDSELLGITSEPVGTGDILEEQTEGALLTGYPGLAWAIAMQRLYEEARQSVFNAGGGILTRKEFIKNAGFQIMAPARALCLLARAGMPFMLMMQTRTAPAKPQGIQIAG